MEFETFGQTASESLSCGTPVAAFDTSGLRDIIDHQKNGYLAEPYDPADLAYGIQWLFEKLDRDQAKLQRDARAKAQSKFDVQVVAKTHHELYSEAILGGLE